MHTLTLVYVTVLENVRAQIKARGAKTIRGLGRTFRNFDSFDGNHQIDREEFYSGLCEIQIRISRQEADALMALFDTNGDGYVNFDEFLVGIRVSHPSSRPCRHQWGSPLTAKIAECAAPTYEFAKT